MTIDHSDHSDHSDHELSMIAVVGLALYGAVPRNTV